MTYTLGIDLGTTYSAVAVHRDGVTEIVALDHRSMVVPSAVFLTADGEVLVGSAAVRRGGDEPGSLAREFKRRLGDPVPLLVGGTSRTAQELTALLLRRLHADVSAQQGGSPDRTVLTFPANWGLHKQDLFAEAIQLADVGSTATLTEPEAAAIWYASAERVAPGETVAVYDLGGGTFDAAVLRKTDTGFAVLGTPHGIERLGGIDADEAVFRHTCRLLELDPGAFGGEEATRRAITRLRAECVDAKEALSADTAVTIPVALPGLHRDVRLTRAELESMVRPVLQDTIHALRETIASAGLHTDDVDRVLLVGGASRMPIVSDLVSEALGRPFFVDAHPKHAVALGAALAATTPAAFEPSPPPPPTTPFPPQVAPSPAGDDPPEPVDQVHVGQEPPTAPPLPDGWIAPTGPQAAPAGPTQPDGASQDAPAPVGTETEPNGEDPDHAPPKRIWRWAFLPAAALLIIGAIITLGQGGGDDDEPPDTQPATTQPPREPVPGNPGGEAIDLAVFSEGVPTHIDPALEATFASTQIVDMVYDGLTGLDARDPEATTVVPKVAASYDTNEDATVWRFTLHEGLRFSDGTPVLPSSFVRGWERATDTDLTTDPAATFALIEGGQAKIDGEADEISGITADDSALTLEVTLTSPMASFDALVASQAFMPMPEAVERLTDPADWENGAMIGNGPFMLDAPRTAEGLVLVRNPEWDGTRYDPALLLPEQPFLERVTFRASEGPDAAYQAFESGESNISTVPPGSLAEAGARYDHTLDGPFFASYHLQVSWDDPIVGGTDNRLLRLALSRAIDRDAVNEALAEGTARPATGLTTPGTPGFAADLCDHCTFDLDAAQRAFAQWQAQGNVLGEPIRVQSGALPGSSDRAVATIVDNLNAAGIAAVEEPLGDEYFDRLSDGGCQLCVVVAHAAYPAYDAFLGDLFHSRSIDRHNFGRFATEDFDRLVDAAAATPAPAERAETFRSAEQRLLNEDVGTIPVLWHPFPLVHDSEMAALPQVGPSLIAWERAYLTG